MKIFVAGATGVIGRSLLPILIKEGPHIIKHVKSIGGHLYFHHGLKD